MGGAVFGKTAGASVAGGTRAWRRHVLNLARSVRVYVNKCDRSHVAMD